MVLYFQQELNGSDPDLADQQPASDAALHCTLLQNIVISLLSGSVMEDANKSLENGQRAESETEDAVSPSKPDNERKSDVEDLMHPLPLPPPSPPNKQKMDRKMDGATDPPETRQRTTQKKKDSNL